MKATLRASRSSLATTRVAPYRGDGNDSFHQFTHRLGLGEQPLFDRLGAPLKNPCSRYVVGKDFSGFVVGRNAAKNGKTRCLPAVTTKNCFSENGVRAAV